MLDATLINLTRTQLDQMAEFLDNRGVNANQVTWVGFAIGLLAMPLILSDWMLLALIPFALNRLADGLDGALARRQGPTDAGAFLDIALDFLFYSSVPLAFALADPANNALAAAVLLFSFIGTGSSFLAFAILAQKRNLKSLAFPRKGFYYLGGLTESTETMICFALFCIWPEHFSIIAFIFAGLCVITTALRIRAGATTFV